VIRIGLRRNGLLRILLIRGRLRSICEKVWRDEVKEVARV
jgi:hypothetical protein